MLQEKAVEATNQKEGEREKPMPEEQEGNLSYLRSRYRWKKPNVYV
jgi:hypothetical protein